MNYCLIGYGKMGKTIDKILRERGHQIASVIRSDNQALLKGALQNADMAIEFSCPNAAAHNLIACFEAKVPVVCGTTGWTHQWAEVQEKRQMLKGALLYASNFSIGVNILFAVNKLLAELMNRFPTYKVNLSEWHHIHKKDAPSGTMISLVNDIIEAHSLYDSWTLNDNVASDQTIPVKAIRQGDIVGIHEIRYRSDTDQLAIRHEAFNRNGFALGAVLASEWLYGKVGTFSMQDVLFQK